METSALNATNVEEIFVQISKQSVKFIVYFQVPTLLKHILHTALWNQSGDILVPIITCSNIQVGSCLPPPLLLTSLLVDSPFSLPLTVVRSAVETVEYQHCCSIYVYMHMLFYFHSSYGKYLCLSVSTTSSLVYSQNCDVRMRICCYLK